MQLLGSILYDTVYHSAPIILCVIGGVFAFKANVLNIALEGMMGISAFFSVLVTYSTGSIVGGLIAGVSMALLFGTLFSLAGVTFKGNVIVIGLALNLLATAVADFILVQIDKSNLTLSNLNVADLQIHLPVMGDIPIVGPILSGHPIITYVAFIGIWLTWTLMYRTKFGIYVRVVGENEDAAKSLGLKTDLYKWVAVLIGAVCCGLAGVNLSTERLGLYTSGMTAARGFIALAAIYCGRGDPLVSSLYAILFGLARSLAVNLALFAGPAAGLFDMIPYVAMIVALLIVSIARRRNEKVRGFANG